MTWDTDLEGVPRKIASSDASPLRVIAGPGTGKSFALKRRVARLLEHGTTPERILAVTFTRNAARSLLDDLNSLGTEGCERIRVTTLHSFCFSILNRNEVFQILGRHPRPILSFLRSGVMQFEGAPMLQDILRPSGINTRRDATKIVRAFEAAWARLQHDEPGWALDLADQRFHDALLEWLKFHKAILIGELIPLALQYLRDNPECPERNSFDHVLVDEFQDLNKAEQVLVDLVADNSNQFIIGDADQSIYSFRFAHPEGILEFADTHPGTHDETLVECRRCPKQVVRIATHLIQANYEVGTPPRLEPYPHNPEGEVRIVQWIDLQAEAEGLAKFCRHLLDNRGYTPPELLILCPNRIMGYAIRDELTRQQVPAHSFYNIKLDSPEIHESLAYLSLLCSQDDRVSLRFLLGLGSPTWRTRGYQELRNYCENAGVTPYEALSHTVSGAIKIKYSRSLIERFEQITQRLDSLQGLTGRALLDNLFPADQEWTTSVRDAVGLTEHEDPSAIDLKDILLTQLTQAEQPEEGNFARIMSFHKSKGLTSKVVLVVGCIEGVSPRNVDELRGGERERALQEDRRLFYVAITRCREVLVLSSVVQIPRSTAYTIGAKIKGRGETGETIASRFITELGPARPEPVAGKVWIDNGF